MDNETLRNKLIITLINNIEEESKSNTKNLCIGNNKYMLGQLLRQLKLNDNKYHVSIEAYKKLKKYDTTCGIEQYLFNANKGIRKLNQKNKIKFNSEFHVEHVVAVIKIIEELQSLDRRCLTNKEINRIINKMHVCVITKEENTKLDTNGYRTNRGNNYRSIIDKGAYKKCGIKVLEGNIFKYFEK